MYHVGEAVAHPSHGGCLVDEVSEKSWMGKTDLFYTLHPLMEPDMKLLIPVKKAGDLGIRNIISKEDAEDIVTRMPNLETNWIVDFGKRKTACAGIIKSGNLNELACLVKTYTHRFHSGKNKLSYTDRELFASGKKKLVSELSLAMGTSYIKMETQVDSAIALSQS